MKITGSFFALFLLMLMTGCTGLEAMLPPLSHDEVVSLPPVTSTPLATFNVPRIKETPQVAVVVSTVSSTAIPASATPEPTETAQPTATAKPTETALPTETPSPTFTPTQNPDAEIEYVVQAGDTALAIAVEHDVDVDDLLVYNGIEDPTLINIDSILRIPVGEARVAAMQATATAIADITPTATLTATLAVDTSDLPSPPTASVEESAEALPERIELAMAHTYQGINNCAPASTSIALSYFGLDKTQYDMASLQKPNSNDVNVTAEEVADSIRETGMKAYVGYNGDMELILQLAAAGFPALTEEWIDYDGGMGHFRTLAGYDQTLQQVLHNDSYYGPGLWRNYDTFLRDWHYYNNKFVVPYHPEQEAELKALIGDNWDEEKMYQNLRAITEAQVEANPADANAWWGLGEALLYLGQPHDAVYAFEQAIATNALPWRYMWYRYGYLEALNEVGRHEEMLAISLNTLNQMGWSENIRYERAVALNALGRNEEAKSELQKALVDNPRFVVASVLLTELGG